VYSQPTNLVQAFRLSNDARYVQQWTRQHAMSMRNAAIQQEGGLQALIQKRGNPPIDNGNGNDNGNGSGLPSGIRPGGPFQPRRQPPVGSDVGQPIGTDWGASILAGGKAGNEMFPAKFDFDVTTTPDCTNDWVVVNTGLGGVTGADAYAIGTFTGNPTAGQTVTINNPINGNSLTLIANTGAPVNASGSVTVLSGPNANDTVTVGSVVYTWVAGSIPAGSNTDVLIGSTAANSATNLEAAINANNFTCVNEPTACFGGGITAPNPAGTATISGAQVTVTSFVPGEDHNFAMADSTAARFTLTGITGGVTTNGNGSNAFRNFQADQGAITDALNLNNAIARNGTGAGTPDVLATQTPVSGPSQVGTDAFTIFAATAGVDGNSTTLAKTLANFTWNHSPLTGGQGQASIVAYNNLYSSQNGGLPAGLCGTTGPTVYWAYDTGTNPVTTSPVISGDGSKVAYVESTAGAAAILHILQWYPGDGGAVNTITFPRIPSGTLLAGQSWTANCPQPISCVANITFSGTTADSDTNSSPFYNYNTDTLYVGDDNGKLHKFTGVFLGTPQEVTTGGWPMTVKGAGVHLSSPVMDTNSVNIFVGDNAGTFSYVKEVGSLSGGVSGTCSGGGNSTPCLGLTLGATTGAVTTINVSTGGTTTSNGGAGDGGAVTDAPLVDGTVSTVYVTNGTESGGSKGVIIETNTALGSGTVGSVIRNLKIGGFIVTGAEAIHTGTFDNTYLNSANGTGNMYVCGKDSGSFDRPALYKLDITAGVLTNSTSGKVLTGLVSADTIACSSVTEVENPNGGGVGVPKEWIFFSVGDSASNSALLGAAGTPCRADTNGCLISIDTSLTWPPAAVTAVATLPSNASGSTSGIIVDNVSTDAQASSIYFTLGTNSAATAGNPGPGLPQCNGRNGLGCVIKLTQSGLK
jgi:hypothetical protein